MLEIFHYVNSHCGSSTDQYLPSKREGKSNNLDVVGIIYRSDGKFQTDLYT